MKLLFPIILFMLSSTTAVAQSFSLKFDSITKTCIKQLPDQYKNKHDTILKHRLSGKMLLRMDTTKYDYLFITENFDYDNSRMSVMENYYFEDPLSRAVYFNNKLFLNEKPESKKSIGSAFRSYKKYYSKLISMQERPYEKWVSRAHTRQCQPIKKMKQLIKSSLRSTYQVQTVVDRKNRTIKVSIQYPVRKPRIFTYYVGGGKC